VAQPSSRQSWRISLRAWIIPLLFGFLCFGIYNANLRQIGAADTLPARYLPLILWRDGTLMLDDHRQLVAQGNSQVRPRNRPAGIIGKGTFLEPWAYWMIRTRQHRLVSLYPVVTPLLVAPIYAPVVSWLDTQGWQQPQLGRAAEVMEKIAASLIAALTSMLLYILLRRDGNRWSLPLAVAFAVGTNTWMISSQALWQHGAGELLIALALLLVTSRASVMRTALLGAVCVAMVANRPPDAVIAAAIMLFVFWSRRRSAVWLFAGAVLPIAALLAYNYAVVGHIAGGYALARTPKNFFQLGWPGVAGLLVSPTRGLLVFSPFLVFVPIGLSERLRNPQTKGLAIMLSLAVVVQIVSYAQGDWRAGVSWGPRWLTNILPILIWLLAPAPLVLKRIGRALLIFTIVFSIGVQTIGAFWYTAVSDELIFAEDPDSMRGAWDFHNIPFITELRHPPAEPELLYDIRGSLDKVGPTLVRSVNEIPVLEHGAPLEGWALAGERTPAQVVVLIDGMVIGTTETFVTREDVNTALNVAAPAGWQVVANTNGVPSGERVLQLAVRITPRGSFRILREQRVFVVVSEPFGEPAATTQPPISEVELDAMAMRATSLLQEHQRDAGFWLTSHTTSTRYVDPKPEMNTFLTSMMVDVLTPIASQYGLEGAVERARAHLAAQIEANGLVRYHGLPNAPTIGTFGCVITPDSDDTALVWRIAGSRTTDSRQPLMLAELARYRDARGLYHTWLAPREQYQCIDPGADPNPSDIAIQLHIYLMLHAFDPAAAQQHCNALQRSFWDEDIWVYYSAAPMIPYLRSAELHQLGCPLPLPIERLLLPAPGQEYWSEATYYLSETRTMPLDEKRRQAIRALLVQLGSNDFEQLRLMPPLLYHNDLSATVRRYYWSEDFGYALWLQLYEATHTP
jgi:hypothetical protein